MRRFANWAVLLEEFLRANRERPFQYGSWDCCLFVCDAIYTMTGCDPAAPFRGRYSSRKAALAEVERYCGQRSIRSVVEFVTARMGMLEIQPAHAGRGDIALIKRPSDYSLAIVALDGQTLLVLGAGGVGQVSRDLSTAAWRV